MATLGDIVVNLRMNHGQFSAGSRSARGDLKGIRSDSSSAAAGIRSVTAAASGLLAVAGSLAVKSGIGLAADLEQTTVKFETLLQSGEAAREFIGEIRDFAASTPFELPQLNEAATTLLAFKTPAEEVIETLRRLGDVSALSGKPLTDLATNFGKARVTGRLMADDVTRFAEAGIPILDELSDRFGVTGNELRKVIESGGATFDVLEAALRRATDAGGLFAGGMQKQSRTVLGLWSTFKDNVSAQLTELGKEITEAIDLRESITDATEFANLLGTAVLDVSKAVRNLAAQHPSIIRFGIGFAGTVAGLGLAKAALSGVLGVLNLITAHPVVALLGVIGGAFVSAFGEGVTWGEKVGSTLDWLGDKVDWLSEKIGDFQSGLAQWIATNVYGLTNEEFQQNRPQFEAPQKPAAAEVAQTAAEKAAAASPIGVAGVSAGLLAGLNAQQEKHAATLADIQRRAAAVENAYARGLIIDTQRNAALAVLREEWDKATGGVQSYLRELQRETELVGATAEQRKLAELAAAGATQQQLAAVSAAQQQLAAAREAHQLAADQKARAAQIAEQFASPATRFAESLEELRSLETADLLGIETIGPALQSYREQFLAGLAIPADSQFAQDLETLAAQFMTGTIDAAELASGLQEIKDAADDSKNSPARREFSSAADLRSGEAFSRVLAAMQNPKDAAVELQKKNNQIAGQQLAELQKLNDGNGIEQPAELIA